MNRPESALQLHRRRVTSIKNVSIIVITLVLFIALLTSFITSQTPWRLNRHSPSVVAESHLKLRWINEVLLPSRIGSIDDQGRITSWIHTQTSGTILSIDANQKSTSSASIILKEYSLFVFADKTHQIWLHRGQKSLQAYSETSNVLWEQRFDTWAENAWASQDGFVLVSSKENETDWKVSLVSNQGALLWTYVTRDVVIADAQIAPLGKGVLLTTRSQQAPNKTDFILLNETGLVLDNLSLPTTSQHQSALHSNGKSAVVTANQELHFLADPKQQVLSPSSMLPSTTSPTTITTEVEAFVTLPAPITALAINEKNREVVAACWDEVNNKGQLVYLSQTKQILWSEPLLTKPFTLGVHPSGFAVYGGGRGEVFTYTNQGEVIWQHRLTENNLVDLAFSPSGEYVAGLDNNGKLMLWQIP